MWNQLPAASPAAEGFTDAAAHPSSSENYPSLAQANPASLQILRERPSKTGDSDDDDEKAKKSHRKLPVDDGEEKSNIKSRRRFQKDVNALVNELSAKVSAVGMDKEGPLTFDPHYDPEAIANWIQEHGSAWKTAIASDDNNNQYNAMKSLRDFIEAGNGIVDNCFNTNLS
ncbi:hypothetical protein HDV00_006868 [Rhizophlyctis rosea]|nr:hypothetical protein HDV00_006868 [Rhizophlyctis rosea]